MKSTPVKMRERCMFLRVRPQTGFRTGIRGVPDDQYDVDDDDYDSKVMINVSVIVIFIVIIIILIVSPHHVINWKPKQLR